MRRFGPRGWLVLLLACALAVAVRWTWTRAAPLAQRGTMTAATAPVAEMPAQPPLALAPAPALPAPPAGPPPPRPPGVVLPGSVVDAVTGIAVPDAALSVSGELSASAAAAPEVPVPLGADGAFHVSIEALGDLPKAGSIRLSASAPHHRARSIDLAVEDVRAAPPVVTISLAPLITLSGRVGTASGAPVEAAGVTACGNGEVAHARTDRAGLYELDIERPTSIVASHPVHGSARLATIDIPAAPPRPLRLPDLLLRPRGEIGGRAEFPDGSPAPRVPIAAILLLPPGTAHGESPAAPNDPCTPDITRDAQVVTDDDGQFVLRDLSDGAYLLRSAAEVRPAAPGEMGVRVGERAAVVQVSFRILTIRLTDASGHPIPRATYSYECLDDAGQPRSSGAGDVTDESGRVGLRIPISGTVLFSAETHTAEVLRAEIAMPATAWSQAHTVALGEPVRKGRVDLDVVDEAGKSVRPFYAWVRRRGSRRTDATAQDTVLSGSTTVTRPLEPGEYFVDVVPGSFGPFGAETEGPPLACARTLVHVKSGEAGTLRVVARLGGRLSVQLRARGASPKPPILGSVVPADSPGDGPIPGLFTLPSADRVRGLEVGERRPFTSALSPGLYLLRVRATGFPDFEQRFEIRAGESTDLDVELGPR